MMVVSILRLRTATEAICMMRFWSPWLAKILNGPGIPGSDCRLGRSPHGTQSMRLAGFPIVPTLFRARNALPLVIAGRRFSSYSAMYRHHSTGTFDNRE